MSRLACWLFAGLLSLGCAHAEEAALYQYATINALLSGLYDGQLTVGELRRHGDLGLGTFNGLDGEMVVVDGTVWQARSDGALIEVSAAQRTPFAVVAPFAADRRLPVAAGLSLTELQQWLDGQLGNPNAYFAFRLDGAFQAMTVRSVPAQQPPYPPLAEAVKGQAVFELGAVTGSLVGFYTPPYMAGLNVPGYHFHFVDAARQRGGHVLALTTAEATLQLDELSHFALEIPHDAAFAAMDLSGSRKAELHRVERQ